MLILASSFLIAAAVALLIVSLYGSASSRLQLAVGSTSESWRSRLDGTPGPEESMLRLCIVIRAVVLLCVAPLLALTVNFLLGGIVAFTAGFLPRLVLDGMRDKYFRRLAEQLPDAVSLLAASMRAKGALVPAIRDVAGKTSGPVAREFQVLWQSIDRYGLDVDKALLRARQRVPVEGFTMICSALIVSLKTGGDLLATLESIAASTRTLSELREKIATETAGLRNEARFAFFAAPVLVLLARLLDDQAWVILFTTVGGNVILAIALGMQVIAWLQIRKILRTFI